MREIYEQSANVSNRLGQRQHGTGKMKKEKEKNSYLPSSSRLVLNHEANWSFILLLLNSSGWMQNEKLLQHRIYLVTVFQMYLKISFNKQISLGEGER